MNTTKTINLSIKVPSDYRYLAQQPFGDFYLFKDKPVLAQGVTGEEFWDCQGSEIAILGSRDHSVLSFLNICEDWKNSVKDLG